jgi:hypothetical protein
MSPNDGVYSVEHGISEGTMHSSVQDDEMRGKDLRRVGLIVEVCSRHHGTILLCVFRFLFFRHP